MLIGVGEGGGKKQHLLSVLLLKKKKIGVQKKGRFLREQNNVNISPHHFKGVKDGFVCMGDGFVLFVWLTTYKRMTGLRCCWEGRCCLVATARSWRDCGVRIKRLRLYFLGESGSVTKMIVELF